MPTINIVIIAVIFIVSYLKFKSRYKMNFKFAAFMQQKNNLNLNDIETTLSMCSVYTNAQLYKMAYEKYNDILDDRNIKESLSQELLERVIQNRAL